MVHRIASVERNTLETQIQINLNLDGTGAGEFKTGIPFFEHMLDQIARHGLIDLELIFRLKSASREDDRIFLNIFHRFPIYVALG